MPRKRAPTTPRPETPTTLPIRKQPAGAEGVTAPGVIALPAGSRYAGSTRIDPGAPARPHWEYHTARSEDGHMWGEPFNALGTEGWELVTIYKTGDAHHAPIYYATFKREVWE